ncbi:AIP3-domain-containing protein [Phellopilus nigrolimitatus]|nr:AIP3-domain-containing protein [Phellopilus nigrolimitatus]
MNGAVAMSLSQGSSSAQHNHAVHPSRRDNLSMSSTQSRASERDRERSSRPPNANPPVESAVTRLLVAIKQLLEALTLWSTLKMSESQVSDVYVRLGNDFNAAVAAFRSFNIDMNELLSVPEDLRSILEQCLSEDATPSNLEIYLPTVRQIITSLLQGLRSKQSVYRRIVSDRKHRTADSQGSDRDSRSTRTSRADSVGSSGGLSRSHLSRSGAPSEGGSNRGSTAEGQRRIASSSRKKELAQPPPLPPPVDESYSPGGFTRPKTPATDDERPSGHRRDLSRSNGVTPSQPPIEYQDTSRPRSSTPGFTFEADNSNETPMTLSPTKEPPVPLVPSNVVRYSLTDNPVPAVVVDGATPPSSSDNVASVALDRQHSTTSTIGTLPETPLTEVARAPVIESSLAALKKSDALERRASKRFSTYNISKMTGGGMKERLGLGRSMNRRSMAADSSNLTPGELNVLTEEDESSSGTSLGGSSRPKTRENLMAKRARTPTPLEEEIPPMPPLPEATTPSSDPAVSAPPLKEFADAVEKRRSIVFSKPATQVEEPGSPTSSALTVFLQLGREVKKVTIERGLSFASLRVLFVDKFSYSPGQDNFPDIYIRDPSSGVMYELEDVEEVKDKCLLSLNIDPLDQIKQHIDQQMSGLTQELKELRGTVGSSNRMSQMVRQPAIVTQPFADNDTPVNRPTDKQFQRVARRLSRLVVTSEETAHTHVNGFTPQMTGTTVVQPQMTGNTLQSQMTGGSMLSEASSRIVLDLKTQFDEVQNLRRDLGVMRQLYVDFISQTKESLSSLRSQTQAVRQLSNAKVGGAREYIDAGKTSLDTRTQNVLTRVEELQDTVENLKDDVLKRFISPRSNVIKTVEKDISEVFSELESLKEYISTVKPMWKKTWEEELQNIVEEQQFLIHQEEFMQDLLEDYKALTEVFGHVEKVISIRGSGAVRTRGFKPPLPEEENGGISTVMMEIRSAAVDPERRLKAIAANQKNREREKAAQSDEFEAELKGFVSSKKLKMTGGAEETERVRQKRNDLALKAMFNSSQSNISAGSTTPTSATSPDPSRRDDPGSPGG